MWEPLVPSSYHHTSCRARPRPRSYCRTSWRSWRRPQCRDRRPQPAGPPSTPAESRRVIKAWCFGCSTTFNLTFLFIDNVSRAERSLSGSVNDFSSSCWNVNFEGNFFFLLQNWINMSVSLQKSCDAFKASPAEKRISGAAFNQYSKSVETFRKSNSHHYRTT